MGKIKIVCLGDSTTYGFPYGPQISWVKMLEKVISGEVINQGINGNTTSNMLNRFDKAVLSYKPNFVVITGGINDVVSNESLDRIKFNIEEMIDKSLANYITPIIGLPTPVDFEPWEKVLSKLRDWMINYANQGGIEIIDFANAFYNDDGSIKTDLLLDDGGHPTREGYKQMFRQINPAIFHVNSK